MGNEPRHEPLQGLRVFGLTFPHDDTSPAKFAQRALLNFVADGVAIQFREPPFPTVRRRRAILAAAMPMPEAAVDKDDRLVFHQHHVRPSGKFLSVQPETITEPVQQ